MKRTLIATLLSFGIASGANLGFANDKKEPKVDQTVSITGNDTMQYDVKVFEVKAGSKVKLVLKNIGKVPKIAMGHNIVILKKAWEIF